MPHKTPAGRRLPDRALVFEQPDTDKTRIVLSPYPDPVTLDSLHTGYLINVWEYEPDPVVADVWLVTRLGFYIEQYHQAWLCRRHYYAGRTSYRTDRTDLKTALPWTPNSDPVPGEDVVVLARQTLITLLQNVWAYDLDAPGQPYRVRA